MSFEIRTNDVEELRRVFDEIIEKGQQTMLTLSFEDDNYILFVNPLPICSEVDCAVCLNVSEPAADSEIALEAHQVAGVLSDDEQRAQENR